MSASASISSKIVLITGANQGIGFEIAKALSSKPGYHILIGSRDTQRGIDAAKQLQEQGLHVEPITIEYVSLYSHSAPRVSTKKYSGSPQLF
jgi:NAD(P)-dependent dehydrogenase (short-subunit alcohol dehydrogenase family)